MSHNHTEHHFSSDTGEQYVAIVTGEDGPRFQILLADDTEQAGIRLSADDAQLLGQILQSRYTPAALTKPDTRTNPEIDPNNWRRRFFHGTA